MGAVIKEQFKATAASLRVYTLIAAGFAAVATFLAFADYFRRGVGVEFAPELSLIPAIAGGLLPIAIWLKERHFESGFLWTLPVDRARNAFAKIFAGWLYMMIAAAAFLMWLLILALITKGNITGDEMVRLLAPNAPTTRSIDPSLIQMVQWLPPKAFWLVPFTASTGTYIILSAFMLGFRYPFRWIIGAVIGAFLVAAVGHGIGTDAFWARLSTVIQAVMYGRYGLDTLLSARTESVHTTIALTSGELVPAWRALPTVGDWIVGTVLWIALGIILPTAALYRRRERR
jgi:hypothetical protein